MSGQSGCATRRDAMCPTTFPLPLHSTPFSRLASGCWAIEQTCRNPVAARCRSGEEGPGAGLDPLDPTAVGGGATAGSLELTVPGVGAGRDPGRVEYVLTCAGPDSGGSHRLESYRSRRLLGIDGSESDEIGRGSDPCTRLKHVRGPDDAEAAESGPCQNEAVT